MACQGAGVVLEAYCHRTLQNTCRACGGEGVLRGGGSAAPSAASTAAAQLAGYEEELRQHKATLAGCADSQELELRATLIHQLERAAGRLRQRVGGALPL